MIGNEPIATAVLLTAFGILLAASVGLSRASARLGLPVALLFLFIGVLAGSEGIGRIDVVGPVPNWLPTLRRSLVNYARLHPGHEFPPKRMT